MIKGERRRVLTFSQILLLLMGIFVVYLVVSFVRQVGVSHQRRAELEQIEDKIAVASQVQAELVRELDYARSDGAVREWALENGMARSDEVVVLIGWSGRTPVEEVQEPSPDADAPREAWWDLFFGTR